MVIRDAAASRSHARVFEKAGRFYVEDLKSANGTNLNGSPLSSPRPLRSGDTIGIGEVVLSFEEAEPEAGPDDVAPEATAPGAVPDSTIDEASAGADPSATLEQAAPLVRIKTRPPPVRLSPTKRPPATEPDDDEAEPADDSEGTQDSDDAREDGERIQDEEREAFDDDDSADDDSAAGDVDPPRIRALDKRPTTTTTRARARDAKSQPNLSAAERARQRRQLSKSATGRVQLAWNELPRPVRVLAGVLALVATLAVVGFAAKLTFSGSSKPQRPEPAVLRANGEVVSESFGYGEGVDFDRPDLKHFTFSVTSPTRVVGVLHFQAKDVSKDEVIIELNGKTLGSVAPDGIDVDVRELEAVLPADLLAASGEENSLVFDNVTNPPADNTWRIWNLWVETIAIPQLSGEAAARMARDGLERALKFYENRHIGSGNLFKAWKAYREAWLLLESSPDRPDELLQLARSRMREIRPEVDKQCNTLVVQYRQAMSQKRPDSARQILIGIADHFPTREHPCNAYSKSLLADLEE